MYVLVEFDRGLKYRVHICRNLKQVRHLARLWLQRHRNEIVLTDLPAGYEQKAKVWQYISMRNLTRDWLSKHPRILAKAEPDYMLVAFILEIPRER